MDSLRKTAEKTALQHADRGGRGGRGDKRERGYEGCMKGGMKGKGERRKGVERGHIIQKTEVR